MAVYPFAKRFTWWPQVFLGIAFNWGILLAFAAHSGTITLAPFLMYLGAISWTLFYDTIYAHQDREDDALIGVKSTARLFGDQTVAWLWGFIAISAFLMIVALLLVAEGRKLTLVVFGVFVSGLLGVTLLGVNMSWSPTDPAIFFLPSLQEWIYTVPNLAGARAIMIGIGLGIIVTSLRYIFGLEKSYIGDQ